MLQTRKLSTLDFKSSEANTLIESIAGTIIPPSKDPIVVGVASSTNMPYFPYSTFPEGEVPLGKVTTKSRQNRKPDKNTWKNQQQKKKP